MNSKEILIRIRIKDIEDINEILDEIDKSIYYVLFYNLELSKDDVDYSIEVKNRRRKFVNYQ